jgi:hypothetical protein
MIRSIISSDDQIASYPEDKRYPSTLLLGFEKNEPVHVLVGRDEATGDCVVITVYRPEPSKWSDDYRTRRKK